jgi:enoyl-CoA hydratase
MSGRVRIEQDGALTVLTLAHPPLNLFDRAMIDELGAAVHDIAADPPRGLLVRADGRAVSGGLDVGMLSGVAAPEAAGLFADLLDITNTVEALPLPTVFAAHALTLTAAFELALGCDLLLAARSARFGLVEEVVALTPAMGGTQRLVERAGPARAREVVMTGELFDAETLGRWNVVNRVLPDDGFGEAARVFARRLAQGPTRAHAATKAIVRAALDGGGARAADDVTADLVAPLVESEDHRGAVVSFLERGPGHAVCQGR